MTILEVPKENMKDNGVHKGPEEFGESLNVSASKTIIRFTTACLLKQLIVAGSFLTFPKTR